MSVVCGFHQAVPGSITPFLRDELQLSRIVIGWHFSLYAIGMFATGFIVTYCSKRVSPKRILLTGSFAVTIAVAIFSR
ncbi:MFS transporter [Pectobacterium sp. 1950-15]|uniref:MFS transporter n=1 Tax=Pectobacterium sp. 1950-15 TaxID=3128982 RepID=UPI003FA7E483